MCTEREGRELVRIWKKYRWHLKEVDAGDAEILNGLIGSSAKVRFRFGMDGKLYAKVGIPPKIHR